jgi:hypothetical protein
MRKSVSSSKAITSTKDLQQPTNRQPKTYEATDHGLIRWEHQKGEWMPIQIANFTGRIIEDLTVDDGVTVGHEYRVEVVLNGGKTISTVDLPSSKFDRMNWTGEAFGVAAIINASCERQVRAAIKYLSTGYTSRNVFRHTGWRKVGGRMLFLHAGGAIGKAGPIRSIETKLSKDLNGFILPAPPRTLGRLAEVTGALLRYLDVAPDRITVLLLSAMCRAPLGGANFSMQVTGGYGSGKSAAAAPMQQCFAPKMDGNNLHITWSSSENFLEQMAFEAKDSILIIDDFKPTGTPQQKQELHAKADRVLRAQGNRSGRGRLTADLETVSSKPPRGLIISTGEETPNGGSLQSRMVVLELGPFDVDKKVLTEVQEYAAAGVYAEATAAFIRWLSDHMDGMDVLILAELNRYRRLFHGNSKGLKRGPDNIFQLAIALRMFLSFTVDMKALTMDQAQAVWSRAIKAYDEAMRTQQTQQTIIDPCVRFFELIGALINSGQGHIADGKAGGAPSKAEAHWGWKQRDDGKPGRQPQGECLGWLHRDGLFLVEPKIWPAVCDLAQRCHERFDISFTQLKKQLLQRSLLLSSDIDTKRRSFSVRKTCAGKEYGGLLHVSPKSALGGGGGIFADESDGSRKVATVWENSSDFNPFFGGKQKANRRILLPNDSMGSGESVGFVGKKGGRGHFGVQDSSDSSSDAVLLPTKTSPKSDENGHGRLNEWTRAGFDSRDAFEVWFEQLYANHPTRGALQTARDLIADRVQDGTFQREAFEAGYTEWRTSQAWTREAGRFIPKLSTFVQDRGWKFPPVEPTPTESNGAKAHAASTSNASAHSPTAAERRAERLKNI